MCTEDQDDRDWTVDDTENKLAGWRILEVEIHLS